MAYGIVTVRHQTEVFYIPRIPVAAVTRAFWTDRMDRWDSGRFRGRFCAVALAPAKPRSAEFSVEGRVEKASQRPGILPRFRLWGEAFRCRFRCRSDPQTRQATKNDGPPHVCFSVRPTPSEPQAERPWRASCYPGFSWHYWEPSSQLGAIIGIRILRKSGTTS